MAGSKARRCATRYFAISKVLLYNTRMTLFQTVFLAIVQGLTEFIPVSSSAHLAIFQHFFHLAPPVEFDVLVHAGTLMAVGWFFRHRLVSFWRERKKQSTQRYFLLILYASLPAVVVGLFLEPYLKVFFGSLAVVGGGLLITGILLLRAREKKPGKLLTAGPALRVGLAQAAALIPGISRSGSTIGVGLLSGLSRQQAFELSFLLAIPATLGALVLQLPELLAVEGLLVQRIMGLTVSAGVGFLALGWLEKVLQKGRLAWFGGYCVVIGGLVFLVSI